MNRLPYLSRVCNNRTNWTMDMDGFKRVQCHPNNVGHGNDKNPWQDPRIIIIVVKREHVHPLARNPLQEAKHGWVWLCSRQILDDTHAMTLSDHPQALPNLLLFPPPRFPCLSLLLFQSPKLYTLRLLNLQTLCLSHVIVKKHTHCLDRSLGSMEAHEVLHREPIDLSAPSHK